MLTGVTLRGLLILATLTVSGELCAAPPQSPAVPDDVRVLSHGHGWTFTDSGGRALYRFADDEKEKGKSLCNDECAQKWPPLPVRSGQVPVGEWSTIFRDDGSLQWAFRGAPVYRYSGDPAPGTTYGDFDWNWSVVMEQIPVPPGIGIRKTLRGYVAVNERQLTLYTSTVSSECAGKCRESWVPAKAPQLANPFDDWGIVSASDGTRQWTFKNKPLFHYVGDVQPGETAGADAAWEIAVLSPPNPRPTWVTVQGTDAGEMFADEQHMIIYAYGAETDISEQVRCDGIGCRDWRPRLAEARTERVGDCDRPPASGPGRMLV